MWCERRMRLPLRSFHYPQETSCCCRHRPLAARQFLLRFCRSPASADRASV